MENVLIWDTEAPQPAGDLMIVLWRAFSAGASPSSVSIPQLIEENADALRTSYLAWVYELGELRVQGRRLIDHLQLRPGFSYWWMTQLVEKCNYEKSPQIDDAIRLLAFTDWAAGRALGRVTLASANQPLAECLRLWCEKLGVAFEWQRLPKPAVSMSWARRVHTALPVAMQAWVWLLKYLLERWPLRGVGLNDWQKSTGRVTFVTYSAYCVLDTAQQGRYENRYWAHLPDVLKRESCQTNWLHLYVKDNLLPTAKRAATAFHAFNKKEQGQQRHVALDTFIGLGVVLRTLCDWLNLVRIGAKLGGELNYSQKSSFDLWPLLSADWQVSIFGAGAMDNLLRLNLFESALKNLPKKQQGVYLQENQGWEFGLIYAWHAAGHGRLMGTPHSTVRFWDLRYFFDPRSYLRTGHNDLPLPDGVACNGPVVRATYQQGGYPIKDLVDVEALRYLHLGQNKIATRPVQTRIGTSNRLLVLGDYLPSNTRRQMKLLEQAVPLFPQQLSITVKPHPNCPIQPDDYPALQMQISMEPISKLLAKCDVAYASAATSASVDAYCAGVPIVSVMDPNTLNLSPLRGCVGALFASTAEALADALTSVANSHQASANRPMYFIVDAQLPNWRRLLL
jgi:surface carbohydrate biosynthesis protein (TIGR04326 family)